MARLDLKNKVVHAKVVYYGPGLCGKTANLEYIAKTVASGQELMSLATEGDRTIFFDFLPLGLGKVRGLDVQFKFYTVPGQVRYAETRKMVLKNVDALVFVADSQPLMMDGNLESLDDLFLNLRELAIDDRKVPIVMQYNKRDLPGVLPPSELDAALNSRRFPTFLASAKTGHGVLDTLNGVCNLAMNALKAQLVEGDAAPSERMPVAAPAPVPSVPTSVRSAPVAKPQALPSPSPLAHGAPAARPGTSPGIAPAVPSPPAGLASGPVPAAPPAAPSGSGPRPAPGMARPPIAPPGGDARAGATARAEPTASTQSQTVSSAVPKFESSTFPSPSSAVESSIRALLTEANGVLGLMKEQIALLHGAQRPKADDSALKTLLEPLATRAELANIGRRLDVLSESAKGAAHAPVKSEELSALRTAVSDLAKRIDDDFASLRLELGAIERRARDEVRKEVLEQLASKADLAALAQRLDRLPTKSQLDELRRAPPAAKDIGSVGAPPKPRMDARPAPAPSPRVALARPPQHDAAVFSSPTVGPPPIGMGGDPPAGISTHEDAGPPTTQSKPTISAPPAPAESDAAVVAAMAEIPPPMGPVNAVAPPPPDTPPAGAAPSQELAALAPSPEPPTVTPVAEARAPEAAVAPPSPAEPPAPPPPPPEAAAAPPEATATPPAGVATAVGLRDAETPEAPAVAEAPTTREVAAAPSPAPAPAYPADDPRHINAARVARVMVADLHLYHKEAVETGIRQNDFFERNKEALGDIRATYAARIPEDVRNESDHLDRAIQEFIAKKKKQWGVDA